MENNLNNVNEADSGFIINHLPFEPANEPIETGLSKTDSKHGQRIDYRILPEDIQILFPECTPAEPEIYIQFASITFSVKLSIDLKEHRELARIYYTWKLHQHFIRQKNYHTKNYVDQLEVWDLQQKDEKAAHFCRFSLKVEMGKGGELPAIRVSYSGRSSILSKNLLELSSQHPEAIDAVTKVIYNKRIVKLKNLSPAGLQNRDQVYPILNPELRTLLGIKKTTVLDLKKFRTHVDLIETFAGKYLHTPEMQAEFRFKPNWKNVYNHSAFRISDPEINFIFANGGKHQDVYTGLLQYGPYRPVTTTQIKFFFIYHRSETEYRDQLAAYLSSKETNKGLIRFTKAPTCYDQGLDIVYDDREDPMEEIRRQVYQLSLDTRTGYLGLYLSPYDEWEQDTHKHTLYYHIKEALLQRGIASQTIDRDKFWRAGTAFRWWVPNIAIAAIAKLGGIPWVLDKPLAAGKDLVVGFGLYSTLKYNMRVVGSSVCFTEDGKFEEYDFFPESEGFQLAAQLEKALMKYLRRHEAIDRLVIHYYKDISQQDFKPVQEMIDQLRPGLPVVAVHIHSTKTDLHLVQNTHDPVGLPLNGSYFHLGDHQYVLYTNDYKTKGIPGRFLPLPIQLGLQCSVPEMLEDQFVVASLIEQVHSFSFLHWRSILQPPFPVTVAFPKMLASQMVWFEREVDVEGADGIPWFL